MTFWEKVLEFFKELFSVKIEPPTTPTEPTPPAVPVVPAVPALPWLALAVTQIGQKEVAGTAHNNPTILSYGVAVGYNGYKATQNDEVPWCAIFVSWCLQQTGFKDTNSAAAASYDKYGDECELKAGAVVTLKHPSGGRHVTFCFDAGDAKTFKALGGNQANAVKVSIYNKTEIVSVRWPIKA